MNVTHKKRYKSYDGKTNDVSIAFIGYVNDLNKLQQFRVSVEKQPPSTSMHISTLFIKFRGLNYSSRVHLWMDWLFAPEYRCFLP